MRRSRLGCCPVHSDARPRRGCTDRIRFACPVSSERYRPVGPAGLPRAAVSGLLAKAYEPSRSASGASGYAVSCGSAPNACASAFGALAAILADQFRLRRGYSFLGLVFWLRSGLMEVGRGVFCEKRRGIWAVCRTHTVACRRGKDRCLWSLPWSYIATREPARGYPHDSAQ
jgi:hypothetical protein